jgi:hypothetical protein
MTVYFRLHTTIMVALRRRKRDVLVGLLLVFLLQATVNYWLLDKFKLIKNDPPQSSSNILWIPSQVDLTLADAAPGRNGTSYNPFQNCSATSQVRIILPPMNDQKRDQQKWIVQSLDRFGTLKTVGGDEYYITYQQHASVTTTFNAAAAANDNKRPTAVAFITDRNDGTYELDFVSPPIRTETEVATTAAADASHDGSSVAILTVHFVYTCGIGNAHQPQKHEWKTGGATRVRHHANVSMIQPPPIRTFQPPGRNVDLYRFDKVVFFGDSMIQQMAGYYHHRSPETSRLQREHSETAVQLNLCLMVAITRGVAW